MPEAKRKLRTAADVISRLKWDISFQDLQEDLVLGYNDRIHGPLEKSLQDYVPASQGGDIPEHRINYFRVGKDILWDRRSRLDKIFTGSGSQHATVCEETLSDVVHSQSTAMRLADERQIRLLERIKRSQKRQRKILSNDDSSASNTSADRHIWTKTRIVTSVNSKQSLPLRQISVVTWNVLFDLYDTEPAEERWRLSIHCLKAETADVVLLQEVTPSYARMLFSCDWFAENYNASATLDNLASVEPFGNLLLWKHSVFELANESSIFTCFDGDRNRAVLGVLKNNRHIFIVSNVHLPADHAMVLRSDKNDIISPKERRVARERERSAIIAKCHELQTSYESKGFQATCVMAGDFNIVEEVEVMDGHFNRFFQDSWSSASSERGDTFDPVLNVRAISNKPPRRIDRIFVGDTLREMYSQEKQLLTPVSGSMIGTPNTVDADRCPSDHYGVRVDFELNKAMLPIATNPGPTAWSCCSSSSCETVLALCFCYDEMTSAELVDQGSSLPVAHLTMLHGFVELNSDESRRLAAKSIEGAASLALEGTNFSLFFDENSLTVFEHRASASLVYVPTKSSDSNLWLWALYSILRAFFPQCDDQEVRFNDGWCPHGKFDADGCLLTNIFMIVTIGTYPTVELARLAAKKNVLAGTKLQLNAQSLGVFQRSHDDGKFYLISGVPLVHSNHNTSHLTAISRNVSTFINDAGSYSWTCFKSVADLTVSEVHRSCQWVLEKYWVGLAAKVRPYGSYLLSSSILGISDIDLIVDIAPRVLEVALDAFDELLFFRRLKTRLRQVYSRSNVRLRLAGTPGDAHFYILTVKLEPHLPSMDLMLNVHGAFHSTSAAIGRGSEPEKSIEDSLCILGLIGNAKSDFTAALRLVKAWAFRRHIYGNAVGYLGGGGWAVLLAYHMLLNSGANTANHKGTRHSLAVSFLLRLPAMLKNSPVDFDLRGSLLTRVALPGDDGPSDDAPLHIWSPISRKNHARNSTNGTHKTMIFEAERARLLLLKRHHFASLDEEFEEVMAPLEREHVYGAAIFKIAICFRHHDIQASVQELRAWLCRQALTLMLSFEREYGIVGSDVRPQCRTERIQEKLMITMAANFIVAPSFVERRKLALQQEFRATFGGIADSVAPDRIGEIVTLDIEQI